MRYKSPLWDTIQLWLGTELARDGDGCLLEAVSSLHALSLRIRRYVPPGPELKSLLGRPVGVLTVFSYSTLMSAFRNFKAWPLTSRVAFFLMFNGNLKQEISYAFKFHQMWSKQTSQEILNILIFPVIWRFYIYLSSHPRCHLHTESESHPYSPKGVRQSTTHPGGKKGRKKES